MITMSKQILEAHYENRVYYFNVINKDSKQIAINMYSTPYIFVKVDNKWENHANNKNNMVQGLVDVVVATLEAME